MDVRRFGFQSWDDGTRLYRASRGPAILPHPLLRLEPCRCWWCWCKPTQPNPTQRRTLSPSAAPPRLNQPPSSSFSSSSSSSFSSPSSSYFSSSATLLYHPRLATHCYLPPYSSSYSPFSSSSSSSTYYCFSSSCLRPSPLKPTPLQPSQPVQTHLHALATFVLCPRPLPRSPSERSPRNTYFLPFRPIPQPRPIPKRGKKKKKKKKILTFLAARYDPNDLSESASRCCSRE